MQYAVIFRAKIKHLNDDYKKLAADLRQLAIDEYGCLEFVSATQGDEEIAVSYWQDEAAIKRWRLASKHQVAQKMALEKWYQCYQVDVVKIMRHYKKSS